MIRRFLVSSCLADVTQQIHSLRASGVISAHTAFTRGSASTALRKSAGIVCTTPPASSMLVRTSRNRRLSAALRELLPRGLMELNRVAVGIFDLNLLAAGTYLDFVSKSGACSLERGQGGIEIVDVEDDPVPSPRSLSAPVRHRPRPRAPWAA